MSTLLGNENQYHKFDLDDEVSFVHAGGTLFGKIVRVSNMGDSFHVLVGHERYAVERPELTLERRAA